MNTSLDVDLDSRGSVSRVKSAVLIFLAFLFVVPVTVFEAFGLPIPLSELTLVLGFICCALSVFRFDSFLFLLAIFMSAVSALSIMLSHSGYFQVRPIFSVVFFFKPMLAYFLGIKILILRQSWRNF